jgi:hypothetical protein
MAEDAVIDTSPDIVLRLAWTKRFSVPGHLAAGSPATQRSRRFRAEVRADLNE